MDGCRTRKATVASNRRLSATFVGILDRRSRGSDWQLLTPAPPLCCPPIGHGCLRRDLWPMRRGTLERGSFHLSKDSRTAQFGAGLRQVRNLFTSCSSFLGVLNQGHGESHFDLFCCAIECVFTCVCVGVCLYAVLEYLVVF